MSAPVLTGGADEAEVSVFKPQHSVTAMDQCLMSILFKTNLICMSCVGIYLQSLPQTELYPRKSVCTVNFRPFFTFHIALPGGSTTIFHETFPRVPPKWLPMNISGNHCGNI